jgi:hypothetical protein
MQHIFSNTGELTSPEYHNQKQVLLLSKYAVTMMHYNMWRIYADKVGAGRVVYAGIFGITDPCRSASR